MKINNMYVPLWNKPRGDDLHYYAERRNYGEMKILLQEFPTFVNCKNEEGLTSLALVTKTTWDVNTKEEKQIMELLLTNGADPMMEHFDGKPIALHAFRNGDVEVMRIFAEHIPNIDTYFDGYTPLYHAVTQGERELGKYCLDRDASVHQIYSNNMTLIHIAMDIHEYSMVQLLLSYGCDVNAKMSNGNTALHMAATDNNAEYVIKELIKYNADVNAQNNQGETPLNLLAQKPYFDFEVFRTLLNSGCDVNIPNLNGLTPLHSFSYRFKFRKHDQLFRNNCKGFVKLMLRKGANVLAVSNFGETTVDTALRTDRFEVAQILIKYITPRLMDRDHENDPVTYSFENNAKYQSIAEKCKNEFCKLMNEKIPGSHLRYKDLENNFRRVVEIIKDTGVENAIGQMIIRRRCLYGNEFIEKTQKVLDSAKMMKLLNELFGKTLPVLCIDKIHGYFTHQDCERTFRSRRSRVYQRRNNRC